MSNIKENPLKAEKRKKLHSMREAGIDPYPHTFAKDSSIKNIKDKFSSIEVGEIQETSVFTIAGRLMTKRPMGKAAFFNVADQDGNIQVYLKKSELSETDCITFENIDIGDIVGITGFVFKTRKGELSLHCKNFTCLCKSLEPLPEKFHGLQDIETKYRFRHLDLITSDESRKVFITRSKIISEIRNWLNNKGFLEVDTPVLQPIYGGAAAHPFTTHHRSLDMQLFLRISPELYLKRLIVGGFEKVYEVSKNFRNEGIDRSHNPEFTLLEWYEAYTDYEYQMTQFETLVNHLAKTICGKEVITYQGKEMDFSLPWKRLTVFEGIAEYSDIDPEKSTEAELKSFIESKGGAVKKNSNRGELLMEVFELSAEPHLWNPTFVMDHPIEISPLTKAHRNKKGLVERFEPFAGGMEIGNAYTELNDPEDQLERLQAQEQRKEDDEEAHPMDEDFLHAIDVGMPPTGGVGIGVERIVMLLTDQSSIRDILLFPTMRPKSKVKSDEASAGEATLKG